MIEKYNGLNLIRVPKVKVKEFSIVRALGNGETLEQMYSRLSPKPDILINGGFFNFTDRWTTAALKISNTLVRPKSAVNYGYALCINKDIVKFMTIGTKTFEEVTKEFPNAIESSPLILPSLVSNQLDSNIVNGKHMRTAFGINEKTGDVHIYVTDSTKKMTCAELGIEAKKYGTTHLLNFDGGGSSLALFQGKRVNNQPGKRPVANAIAIYFNEDKKEDPKPTIPTQPIKKKLLALDAGHGMKTAGKGVPEMREHEFNSAVVKYAKELAEHNGFDVLLTQPLFSDYDTPLITRTNLARDSKADLLMSYHADANGDPNARGHWCFFWTGHEPSGRLASLWDKYADALMNQTLDRNYRESIPGTWSEFHMCREPVKYGIPAILMEHAFMTNKDDLRLLLNDDFRRKCAEVSIRAACDYFGMTFKPLPQPNQPIPQQPSNILYRVQVGAFGVKSNAENLKKELESKGYKPIIVEVEK